MLKPFKSFNSKGFLLLYLVVIVIMLTLWLSRLQLTQQDKRIIPADLAPFLLSPAKPIPQFLFSSQPNKILTNQSLKDSWSFVYFTHPNCRPQCEPILAVLENLKRYFAAQDIQFLLISFDVFQNQKLRTGRAAMLPSDIPVYSGEQTVIDEVAKSFGFLYLRNAVEQGYSLEQQHHIYLVDPKGRVYARFKPPFTSLLVQQEFFEIRDFYARNE